MACHPLYIIKDWSDHFENSRTRQLETMRWVPIPNQFDGDKISELIDHAGAAGYGAWCALLLIAGKCQERGTLLRSNGRPHTPVSMARMTGIDAKAFASMLEIAVDVGLVERKSLQHKDPALERHPSDTRVTPECHPSDTQVRSNDYGMEWNGREGREEEVCAEPPQAEDAAPSDPIIISFPTKGKPDTWHLKQSKVDEYKESFGELDVVAEARKALQWIRDTPAKRKTARGMPAFLTRWLNRAVEKGGGQPARASPADKSRRVLASMEQRLQGLLVTHRTGTRSMKPFVANLLEKHLSASEQQDTSIVRLVEQFDHPPGGSRSMNPEGHL